MTPIAIPLYRYSDPTQGEGNSEARQTEGFEFFLARSGMKSSARSYFDRGLSGYHAHHLDGEFGQLLADCQAKKFPAGSVVWFEDNDRFGRAELRPTLDWLHTITSNGYRVYVDSLGRYIDASTPEMELVPFIFKTMLAHDESVKKSVRGLDNEKKLRQTGVTKKGARPARCPFWISVVDGEYVLNGYDKLVKDMFRLSAEGHGAEEISKQLGNPSRPMKRKGKTIEARIDVLGVLRNRACIGEYQPCQKIGKNKVKPIGPPKLEYYPAVVSEDLFCKVQGELSSRATMRGRRGEVVTNLFTELLFGSDGETMYIKWHTSGRLLRRRTAPPANEQRTWQYAEIETRLLRHLQEVSLTATLVSPIERYEAELRDVTERCDILRGRIETVQNLRGLLDTLSTLEGKRQSLLDAIEAEKGRMPESQALLQAQQLVAYLLTHPEEAETVRTRLKANIRRLISRIDVAYLKGKNGKVCKMVVSFVNGEKRRLFIGDLGNHVEYDHVCDDSGTKEVWRVKVS